MLASYALEEGRRGSRRVSKDEKKGRSGAERLVPALDSADNDEKPDSRAAI